MTSRSWNKAGNRPGDRPRDATGEPEDKSWSRSWQRHAGIAEKRFFTSYGSLAAVPIDELQALLAALPAGVGPGIEAAAALRSAVDQELARRRIQP